MRNKSSVVVQMPMEQLRAPISSVNAEARTFDVQWLSGTRIKRMDWMSGEIYMLEFSKDAGACRLGRLKAGTAPVLNAHGQWSLSHQLGVVEAADYQGGIGTGRVRLSKRDDVKPILQDVQDGIICNVSAGISIHRLQLLPADASSEGLPIRLATDFEPMEISFVPIGADAGAGVLADQQRQHLAMHPCEVVNLTAEPAINPKETSTMKTPEQLAAEAEAAKIKQQEQERLAAEQERQRLVAAEKEAANAERTRIKLINDLCGRHNLSAELRAELTDNGATSDQIRTRVLEELAKQTTPIRSGSHADVHIVGDTRLQLRAHMAEAIAHRVDPSGIKLTDGGRQYRGMSMLRMAEEVLAVEGVKVRGRSALEMATLAMMSTSDFPNILADVANKRLRMAYEENIPSYTRWARRAANAPDFKNINVNQLSGAPDLQAVPEGGEFKYGSLSDGKEVYALVTYGRIIPISRQAIINDDLNAFDRLPRAFSGSARRLENYLVYQQLLANAAMSDGGLLFNNTAVTTPGGHANLLSSTTIDATNLGLARAAMRAQVGLQAEKLNLAPRFLLCGVAKEQVAYQFTSSQFVPATPANVNEFRAGGRTALEPIVEAEITGNKWFLAADNAQCDTVEYCYLDGSEGVYLESQMGFKIDGIELKARLDFAAKAIDWRGLTYNAGA